MKIVKLGKTGLEVSRIGIGGIPPYYALPWTKQLRCYDMPWI